MSRECQHGRRRQVVPSAIRSSPIVVVFNDSSLTLIGVKQRRRQFAPAGVDFAGADFAEIARVERSEDLVPAFAHAAAAGRATRIDVVIDPSEYEAQILALRG